MLRKIQVSGIRQKPSTTTGRFKSRQILKTVIVIPARLESTRLPRKLLLRQTGKTLIEHAFIASSRSRLAERVIVATDSEEIVSAVRQFGGEAVMTSVHHQSGSDRVAEAAAAIEADLIVNVQGDEPEIEGASIDCLIRTLMENESVPVATLAAPIRSKQQLFDPSCVKVVCDQSGKALYFSRSPIPASRDEGWLDDYFSRELWPTSSTPIEEIPAVFFQHLGIYAYRREFLLQIPEMPRSNAEQIESLEQLRFLHYGHEVMVETVDQATSGIDTPDDYLRFVNRYLNR